MTRLRGNFKAGTLTAGITNVATSITSAGFASLPEVVAPDYMLLTLDPLGVYGNPEVVRVTAHAAASTSVTVLRAQDDSSARAHGISPTPTAWKHGAVESDFGQVVFRTVTGLLQEAIDKAEDGGNGGIVPMDPGTHTAAGIVVKDGVELKGSGYGSTKLKLANGANTFLIETEGFAGLTGGDTSGGVKQFGITDMLIDGNKANNSSTVPLVRIYGYDFHLERLRVINSDDHGIYSEWGNDASDPGPSGMEAMVNDVKVGNCDGDGILWKGPHDGKWSQVIAFNNTKIGLNIQENGGALIADQCHSWGLSQEHAWWIGASARMTNCQAEGSQFAKVVWDAHDISWLGGAIFAGQHGGTPLAAASVGIHFGLAASTSIAAAQIFTSIQNCEQGAIFFENDGGGNDITVLIYDESSNGDPLTGSPHTTTARRVQRFGGDGTGNYLYVPEGGMTIGSGDLEIDAANSFKIGSDVSLFRNGANQLRTNDELIAGGDLSHFGSGIGFFGTGGWPKGTVTGSKGGNAALASLLTVLAQYGLITDSSS